MSRPACTFVRMFAQQFFMLPSRLLAARRHSGLSQKAAALNAEMPQTVLCALERGRRTPDNPETLRRLARTYGLSESELHSLSFYGLHDQLMAFISGTSLEPAAELVSELLKATQSLNSDEQRGLAAEMRDITKGKRRILALVGKAAEPKGEEALDM